MQELLYISEQHSRLSLPDLSAGMRSVLIEASYQRPFFYKPEMMCFQLYNDGQAFSVDSNYFIGVDWLVKDSAAIYVEPKLNGRGLQVDFLGMLLESLGATENLAHLDGLFHVDYEQPWIEIPEKKDLLSPILIVQFLKLVQKIVRKGLKKSYYRVTDNLESKVKGKILVGQQIRQNIVRNRSTKMICNYQEYGVNSMENQFLKLVLAFISSWLGANLRFFSPAQGAHLFSLLQYSQPAFTQVDLLKDKHQKFHIQPNAFYKEYADAIRIGNFILKRFSFNISRAGLTQAKVPPFWIDMSKLFELYVFQKLKLIFPETGAVSYHDSFRGGKQTDILIKAAGYESVIDCKYKPRYGDGTPSLEDKRQLAAYVRMKKVYDLLWKGHNQLIPGLIIYSHQSHPAMISRSELFKTEISEYVAFYKLGLSLPTIHHESSST